MSRAAKPVRSTARTTESCTRPAAAPDTSERCQASEIYLVFERLSGLEQRLQAAEDIAPAAGDVSRGLRRGLELVVDHRQLRDVLARNLDLPGDAAERLRGGFGVVQGPPGRHELPRTIGFEHLALDVLPRAVGGPAGVRGAGLVGRLDHAAVEVA